MTAQHCKQGGEFAQGEEDCPCGARFRWAGKMIYCAEHNAAMEVLSVGVLFTLLACVVCGKRVALKTSEGQEPLRLLAKTRRGRICGSYRRFLPFARRAMG